MSKILITYLSQTGNTKKTAEAIYESLEGDKTIKPVDEVQEIENYSLIFIGFPVHSHSVPYKIESFLRKIPEGKKIALFSTHGALPGGRLATEALEHAAVITSKAEVLGTFSCRGKVSMEAMEVLSKSPEHKAWTEMAPSSQTHPDEGDLEDARSFAKLIITLSTQDEV
jgi:flavodoxin